eukprot:4832188-Pyramimonas_sp.AAC.1
MDCRWPLERAACPTRRPWSSATAGQARRLASCRAISMKVRALPRLQRGLLGTVGKLRGNRRLVTQEVLACNLAREN